ncbi:unnamed protein product [Hymenolepis diminuta]|uniref:ABC transmembrane type-1 domain-containing protein n=1 Tax=Hymenolepis diminuta TaxID=6216 RepID=A0A0R3SAG1_HYMDI|nr:unnamed protein product [Hymenolepis diminuta]
MRFSIGTSSSCCPPNPGSCGSGQVFEQVCGKTVEFSDIAYPSLILSVLPPGAKDLMPATIFNVARWKLIKSERSDAELMLSDELFDYIQLVTAYLAPSICAVYVLAIFWKRTNEATILFVISFMVAVCVSLITPPLPPSYVNSLN